MTRRALSMALVLAAGMLELRTAAAAEGFDAACDPWTGPDKTAHFAASAAIATGAYGLGTYAFDARWHALAFGGAVAILAGGGKEIVDLAGAGTPSWKDFAWDLAGTAAGLGLAWIVDLAVRGASGAQPAFGPPHVIRF
jgi:putative lipoprotein